MNGIAGETSSTRKAIRVVAMFEAFKGALVLLAATGLLSLLHKDVSAVALKLVEHAHLNPASKYPSIFLSAAANVHNTRLWFVAAGAAAYAIVRFIEAYGLLRERAWAEVLAAASGAIYIPFEIYGLLHRPTWHRIALVAINLAVVALMLFALRQRRAINPKTHH